MRAPAAQLRPLRRRDSDPARSRPDAAERGPALVRELVRLAGSMPVIIAACLIVAAISLVEPSSPTYDPWAWIMWGREIAHLDLVTEGGPSWKPLPILFTTFRSRSSATTPRPTCGWWSRAPADCSLA